MNYTIPTALILQALEQGYSHGFQIMDVTGLPSGTVYPALRRMEREGLIASAWEEERAAAAEQRPARRYYELNEYGREHLAECRRRFHFLRPPVAARKVRGSHA